MSYQKYLTFVTFFILSESRDFVYYLTYIYLKSRQLTAEKYYIYN